MCKQYRRTLPRERGAMLPSKATKVKGGEVADGERQPKPGRKDVPAEFLVICNHLKDECYKGMTECGKEHVSLKSIRKLHLFFSGHSDLMTP